VREVIRSEDESKGSNGDLRWSQKWSGVAKPALGGANGDGRRGAVVVRAAQLKLPPAKMVDSKCPSVGYYYGSSWRRGWNVVARGEWVLAQACPLNLNRGRAAQKPYCSAGPLRPSGRPL
jgi:hypothetical protein